MRIVLQILCYVALGVWAVYEVIQLVGAIKLRKAKKRLEEITKSISDDTSK